LNQQQNKRPSTHSLRQQSKRVPFVAAGSG
jgi:hypothetical protein